MGTKTRKTNKKKKKRTVDGTGASSDKLSCVQSPVKYWTPLIVENWQQRKRVRTSHGNAVAGAVAAAAAAAAAGCSLRPREKVERSLRPRSLWASPRLPPLPDRQRSVRFTLDCVHYSLPTPPVAMSPETLTYIHPDIFSL
ncbi:unnamed protein product [Merluccius merluccius]